VPRVDPVHRNRIDDEAGGKEKGRYAALVLREIDPEALDCDQGVAKTVIRAA
jgi:hypothetical protein